MAVVKERNPIWYASLEGAGARTIVLFPLKSGSELLGYMWAINFDADNTERIKETLELTTFILASEIENYLLVNKLRTLSSRDMLTGVMNRNEMNNYVDRLSEEEKTEKISVGVVFADLNGLKKVNDCEGHSAGDDLLKNASKVLRAVFEEDKIFRAGGDEFSMILTGVGEDELIKKTTEIKKLAEDYDELVFAAGYAFEPDSRDVRRALRIADERMYEDKRRYYEMFPDKKRIDPHM